MVKNITNNMGIFSTENYRNNQPVKLNYNNKPNTNNIDLQKIDLYRKGITHMSNEKLDDAIKCFELALKMDPKFVDAWIKRGYSYFHLGEYNVAISAFDRALEVDINNAEAWNLKGLAYYRMKNYQKAIESIEKSIDIDPNYGMAWYNFACFLCLSGKINEGLDALKRSIEIDISYAKRAVRDKDFENARGEEGFRRIVEVVVLESIRQGYDYVGKIVWVTGMSKTDVQEAAERLTMKGLLIKREKRTITSKDVYYELTKDIAEKVGSTKRTGFISKTTKTTAPLMQLKDISEVIEKTELAIQKGDVNSTIENFDLLINPNKHGTAVLEQFFDEHRDLRLFQIRLRDKGQEYLNSHKDDLIKFLSRMDTKIRGNLVSK